MTAIRKCAAMGFPFCLYNVQTERYDFLRLHKEFSEELSKCWSLYKEAQVKPGACDSTGSGSRADADSRSAAQDDLTTEDPNKDGGRQAPQKRRRSEKDGANAAIESPARDTSAKKTSQVLTAAVRMKSKYAHATSAAAQLEINITSDPKWGWASTKSVRNNFDDALEQVKRASDTQFAKQIHTHDMATLKRNMEPEALAKACAQYVDLFGGLLTHLTAQVTKLTKMHVVASAD